MLDTVRIRALRIYFFREGIVPLINRYNFIRPSSKVQSSTQRCAQKSNPNLPWSFCAYKGTRRVQPQGRPISIFWLTDLSCTIIFFPLLNILLPSFGYRNQINFAAWSAVYKGCRNNRWMSKLTLKKTLRH